MDLILLPLFSWLPMYSFHGPRAARPPFLRCERKYPFTVGSSVAALAVVPGQLVELIDEGVADPLFPENFRRHHASGRFLRFCEALGSEGF